MQHLLPSAFSCRRAREGTTEGDRKRARRSNVFLAGKGATVLSETIGLDAQVYTPRTRETRSVYEALLGIVKKGVGDQPEVCEGDSW